MAQQLITTGNVAGDGTGDPLRDAFTKINENFTELYSGNVQVTAANVLVHSVAGRIGNVVLTVNDVAQAASKSYVDNSIAANLANVTTTITNSLNANITAANAVISNHSARISTLEGNAAAQASQINNLVSVKANISYVDTSIDLALSSNAILANVQSVNANVAAANAAILLRANLSGASFTGNISANSISAANFIRTDTYFVGGTEINQGLGQTFANPAALFFGNSAIGFDANANTRYYQINVQNLDPFGSADIVATADDGNDSSNFIALGINNSQYNEPQYPFLFPHDGYIFMAGGNLGLQSQSYDISIMAGNLALPQMTVTTGNVLELNNNLSIRFSDGTIQYTAFGGNTNVSAINANIAAANVAIANLQANAAAQALSLDALYANADAQQSTIGSLSANSAVQAVQLNLLNANVAAANTNITTNTSAINLVNANVSAANVVISNLQANAAVQALELDNLQSNAQSQQTNIVGLQANSAAQAVQIDLLNSNLTAANTNISALTANAATQAAQINLINANVSAANVNITNLQSNAASQALDLNNLYTNVNVYLANVASSNANIAAANARIIVIDANLGSTTTNVSVLQSNSAVQALQIDLLNANVTAANLNITSLTANSATQAVSIDLLNANISASNLKVTNIDANIGSFQTYANLTFGANSYTNANVLAYLGAFDGNIIPSANVTYDLGSSTNRWRDLWLSGNTINLGNATLSVVDGSIQSSLPIAANITASNITVSGTRIDFASGGYIEETEVLDGNLQPAGYYGIAINSSDDGIISLNALDTNAAVTSSVFVTNVSVQLNVANSTPGGNYHGWIFDNLGRLTVPVGGDIVDNNYNSVISENASFTMANVTHWTANVSTIGEAINQLAERIYNLENP